MTYPMSAHHHCACYMFLHAQSPFIVFKGGFSHELDRSSTDLSSPPFGGPLSFSRDVPFFHDCWQFFQIKSSPPIGRYELIQFFNFSLSLEYISQFVVRQSLFPGAMVLTMNISYALNTIASSCSLCLAPYGVWRYVLNSDIDHPCPDGAIHMNLEMTRSRHQSAYAKGLNPDYHRHEEEEHLTGNPVSAHPVHELL